MANLVKEKWNSILAYVRDEFDMSPVSYNTWFEPIKVINCSKDTVTISVPDEVTLKYIVKKYEKMLTVAVEEITGTHYQLNFTVEGEEENKESLIRDTSKKVDPHLLSKANLNPKYTFDSFVVGPNNNLAHAAALAVAETPGEVYNPLYIHGGVGLGKTHLMHSIAHFILKNNPNSRILYVTSETFTNDYIESIRNRSGDFTTADFRAKYRNIDVLLIDDIQFIVGKESTQEEFFHTFNSLYENKKQIILSSDKPPKAIDNLEERLRSRFEWGLTVDIQPPNFETRMAILRKKEDMEGYNIDNEVIKFIATNIKSNIRELEGALTKIVAKSRLEHISIDSNMAREILEDYIGTNAQKAVTPELIISMVAEHYNITLLDMASPKRNKEIVYPRQIAMYLCREMTSAPLQQIGKCLGGRDHATIINGINKISDELKTNEQLRTQIDIIKKKISPA
ncbi:MAG: chromosomal replication initiator protein DnaA [Candidatus Avilachnospira sp.]|jgi:chromosomal replication initiator protein